jgi:hypothetical protein
MFKFVLILAVLTNAVTSVQAETVVVKYRGPVDLSPFNCQAVTRSSFVQRVCYDRRNSYMLINLTGTYYHYCEIDASMVSALMEAESIGRFTFGARGLLR